MTRKLRIDWEGAWHHVMHRGAGRRAVFRNDHERALFLRLTAELDERFGLEVHCYCLMGNHFHLVVRSAEGRLSEAMRWLLSQYTRAVNTGRGVDGAIFRGRFHSVSVLSDRHRYVVVPYVLANPVDLGWSGALCDYPWSSLGAQIAPVDHLDVSSWLHRDVIVSLFGDDPAGLIAAVEGRRSDLSVKRDALSSLDQQSRPHDVRIEWSDIRAAVEVGRGMGGTFDSDARANSAALVLALDRYRFSRDEVAEAVGVTTSGLRSTLARARRLYSENPEFARLVAIGADVLQPSVPLGV